MVRIDSGSAAIDLWSLWGGPLRFEKLELVKPVIILERNAEGTGNWAMGAAASIPSPPVPPVASTYAASRLKIPTLIDLALRGGNIRFRTSSGQWQRIELDDLKIRADGADRPLSITGEGAYNDQRGKLTAEGESFDALRDPSHPYGITFSIANPSTSIDFKGTLIDPLAFDGVKAALKIQAQKLGDLLKIFDAETSADIPLLLAGALTRDGGHWKLSDAAGKLAANAFTGTLGLEEAARGQTDDVSLDLAFPQLDLDPILAGMRKPGSAKSTDWRALPLQLEEKRGTNIAWRICAKLLTYAKMRIADFALRGHIAGGEMALEQVKLAFAGGTFSGAASVKNAPGGGHVVAQAGALRGRCRPAVAIGRRPGGPDRRQARWCPFPGHDRRHAQIRPGGEPRPWRARRDPGANRARRDREDLDRSALLFPQARRNGSGELPAGSCRSQERHRHDLAAQDADPGCRARGLWPGRFPQPAARSDGSIRRRLDELLRHGHPRQHQRRLPESAGPGRGRSAHFTQGHRPAAWPPPGHARTGAAEPLPALNGPAVGRHPGPRIPGRRR